MALPTWGVGRPPLRPAQGTMRALVRPASAYVLPRRNWGDQSGARTLACQETRGLHIAPESVAMPLETSFQIPHPSPVHQHRVPEAGAGFRVARDGSGLPSPRVAPAATRGSDDRLCVQRARLRPWPQDTCWRNPYREAESTAERGRILSSNGRRSVPLLPVVTRLFQRRRTIPAE